VHYGSGPPVIPAKLVPDLSGERQSALVIPAKAGIQLPPYTNQDRRSMELASGNSPQRLDAISLRLLPFRGFFKGFLAKRGVGGS
jgi:hypothetical protein